MKMRSPARVFGSLLLAATLCGAGQGQQRDAAWYLQHAPFPMPDVSAPQFPDHDFSIADYGAVPDGQTLNTDAFRRTIQACSAAGGGRVVVPPGLWLTGPIRMESRVDLEVERGAVINFTKDHTQYPVISMSPSGSGLVIASPIYGYGLTDVAITGGGIIDGGGETWRPVKKAKATAEQWKALNASGGVVTNDGSVWWPTRQAAEGEAYLKGLHGKKSGVTPEDLLAARDYLRPYMVYLINCKNVFLKDVTLRNSPKFVFYPNSCTNVRLDHVNIFNEWWAQNGDGIDISRCKNVLVYDCTVSAGDDGICMKSSGGSPGDTAAGLQNVVIAKCVVYHAHGGFVIGSNTDGGMRNIWVRDCDYIGTDEGVRVKSNYGRGGLVTDIYVDHIYMKDIANAAISFDTYYEDMPAGKTKSTLGDVRPDKIPDFTGFHFDHIYCDGAKTAVFIRGLPEQPVSDLEFSNMVISSGRGFDAIQARDIRMDHVRILTPASPVFVLDHVREFSVRHGYMPPGAHVYLSADAASGVVKVTDTDLGNQPGAIQTGSE